MFFDEAPDSAFAPPGTVFQVHTSGPDYSGRRIGGTGSATVSDNEVTVTLAEAVKKCELLALWYGPQLAGANALRDAAGNRAAGAGCWASNDEVCWQSWDAANIDVIPPTVADAVINVSSNTPPRSKVALYFNEALDTASVPATGDFGLSSNAGA